MFYLIRDGKITDSCNKLITGNGITLEKDFSESQLEKIENGSKIILTAGGKFSKLEDTSDSLLKDKEINLNNMTLQELLESQSDFSDLGIKGEQLGKFISDKLVGGNIYKELQEHRIMLKLMKKVLFGGTLTSDELLEIERLEKMDSDAEVILGKFKKK